MIKKILIITPTYPPYQGSHTERMIALVESLKENGLIVGILTTEILKGNYAYNAKLDCDYDSNIEIFRVPFGCLHRGSYLRNNISLSNSHSDVSIRQKSIVHDIKRLFTKVSRKLKHRFLIPDSLVDWYSPAIKYIHKNKIINSFRPDAIMSCSMPNTCHLIGYRIAKEYNLPLIMDIADPWAYISYYAHGKIAFNIEKRVEKKILDYASLISFSTHGCLELYQSKYFIPNEKMLTIVTGYNDSLLSEAERFNEHRIDSHITMIYGGSIQAGGRNPIPFLNSVASKSSEKVFFRLRTDNLPLVKRMIPEGADNIEVLDYAPFDVFFNEMLQSDVLVFFGNATTDQLPGKIFNYIPTGRLILYILSVKDEKHDQAVSIVKDYGNYVIVENNEQSISEGLDKIIKLYKTGELRKPMNIETIKKYSSKNQFRHLSDAIMKI